MYNILDYIRFRGDLSFSASPFNAVDNMILTRLAYIDFNDVGAEETLSDVAGRYDLDNDKWNRMEFTIEETRPLLKMCGNSQRFGNILMSDYVEIIDASKEVQFCAMTFKLMPDSIYIAFRGTDETITGWKEDFNMLYQDQVPSQIEALKYLNSVLDSDSAPHVYVGGHSKGGNLAVYAAVNMQAEYRERIVGVYNNDGPGFKQMPSDMINYDAIKNRIYRFVPENSIVGMLLSHGNMPLIVKSNRKKIFDHSTFAWQVMGPDFEYVSEFSHQVKILDSAIKNTLQTMAIENRKIFVDMVFSAVETAGIQSIMDLDKDGIRKLFRASRAYNAMDKSKRNMVDKHINRFFEEGFKRFVEINELEKIGSKLESWVRNIFSNHS